VRSTKSELDKLLREAGANQTDLAGELGCDSSSVSRKLAGRRPWKLPEIRAILAFLSTRLKRAVTYEEAFGAPEVPHAPAAGEASEARGAA